MDNANLHDRCAVPRGRRYDGVADPVRLPLA